MGSKFGAPEEYWGDIVDTCKKIKADLRGISFYVGTGGCSFETYETQINNVLKISKLVKARHMPALTIVDIGGGFTMNNPKATNNFTTVSPKIAKLLKVFPQDTRFIGEPGRFLC